MTSKKIMLLVLIFIISISTIVSIAGYVINSKLLQYKELNYKESEVAGMPKRQDIKIKNVKEDDKQIIIDTDKSTVVIEKSPIKDEEVVDYIKQSGEYVDKNNKISVNIKNYNSDKSLMQSYISDLNKNYNVDKQYDGLMARYKSIFNTRLIIGDKEVVFFEYAEPEIVRGKYASYLLNTSIGYCIRYKDTENIIEIGSGCNLYGSFNGDYNIRDTLIVDVNKYKAGIIARFLALYWWRAPMIEMNNSLKNERHNIVVSKIGDEWVVNTSLNGKYTKVFRFNINRTDGDIVIYEE